MGRGPGGISVVVCTADRKAKLKRLLESLSDVEMLPDCAAELILVNNAPSTDLVPIVEDASRRLRMPVALVTELERGLARARNRGLRHARGEVIAFTDDDCVVERSWLVNIWRRFTRDPDLMGLGGKVDLANPHDLPITVRTGDAPEQLSAFAEVFGFMHGCNMAFRRVLFERLGGFDTDFGAGSAMKAGEDTEFVYRAFRAGNRIGYEPAVLVWHDHGRTTWRQRRATLNRYHQANGAVLAKFARSGDAPARALLRAMARRPLDLVRRGPRSVSEATRACYQLVMFGLGAARHRVLTWRGSE
jgi:GT2 family glycosyltransferase